MGQMSDFLEISLAEMQEGLRNRSFSSRELTEFFINRIDENDGEIKAFLSLAPKQALKKAEVADKRFAGGEEGLPPLLGIPLAVKDVLAVEGFPATAGSKILEGFNPPYTSTAVSKLLDAGMIVLGKTNTDEFAMGSSTENSAYFTSRNPWDTNRVPGGSSGGSAASVASQMVPVALGTDTGGSVRQPAAFCGVTGLKPTYGRLSRYGLIAYGSSLDSIGVLGRSAADTAALFSMMAGKDALDATSLDIPLPDINLNETTDLKGVKIGVPKEYFVTGIQAEVEEKVREAINHFEELGAEILEVSLPHTQYAVPVYYLIAPAEASANLARFDGVRYGLRVENEDVIEMVKETRGAGFGEEVKRRIMLGTYALSSGYYDAYYGQAQKVRTLIQNDFLEVYKKVDMIAAPVAPTTAFKIGMHTDDPLAMYLEDVYTLPANLAGVPGLAFPVGFDKNKLPVGMQLMGPHFEEENLLQAVKAYQNSTDWHEKKPAE
jgi:aspartyl-tRNA(Asn)/glutamyl-tRNA(Gln) amidotransferase subunit A